MNQAVKYDFNNGCKWQRRRLGSWEGEEHGGNERVENKEVKIPTMGSTPAHHRLPHHPGKTHKLMKCENTCGCGDYGLSKIHLHKLMIKSMSQWRGLNSE